MLTRALFFMKRPQNAGHTLPQSRLSRKISDARDAVQWLSLPEAEDYVKVASYPPSTPEKPDEH